MIVRTLIKANSIKEVNDWWWWPLCNLEVTVHYWTSGRHRIKKNKGLEPLISIIRVDDAGITFATNYLIHFKIAILVLIPIRAVDGCKYWIFCMLLTTYSQYSHNGTSNQHKRSGVFMKSHWWISLYSASEEAHPYW